MSLTRGSERLFCESVRLDQKSLFRVAEISEQHGFLLDWQIFGQPAIDRLRATVELKPEKLGSFLDQLIKVDGVAVDFGVFPYGVPAIDRVLIHIQNGRAPGF